MELSKATSYLILHAVLHRQLKQYHADLTNNYNTAQYATSDTWQITL